MRRRLTHEQSGFTLIELLVAVSIGMIVLLAVVNLLDSSGRAATGVADRVDGTQRGRSALEQITQRLRSQVCPTDATTPVLYGGPNRVTFYSDVPDADPTFIPEVRSIYYDAGGSNQQTSPSAIKEDIFRYTSLASAPMPTAAQIADYSSATPTGTPTERRTLIANTAPIRTGGTSQPVFTYYGFTNNNPGLPERELDTTTTGQLSATDKADVVRITVKFDSRPTRADVQDGQTRRVRSGLDSRFESAVFVRSADPTQSQRDPAPCV